MNLVEIFSILSGSIIFAAIGLSIATEARKRHKSISAVDSNWNKVTAEP